MKNNKHRHVGRIVALRLLAYVLAAQITALVISELVLDDLTGLTEEAVDVVFSTVFSVPAVWLALGGRQGKWPATQIWRLMVVIVLAQVLALGLTYTFTPGFEGSFPEEAIDVVVSALVTAPLLWLNLDHVAIGWPALATHERVGTGSSHDQRVRWVLHATLAGLAGLFLAALLLMWQGEVDGDHQDEVIALLDTQNAAWHQAYEALLAGSADQVKGHIQTAAKIYRMGIETLDRDGVDALGQQSEALQALDDWRLLNQTMATKLREAELGSSFHLELGRALVTTEKLIRIATQQREAHSEAALDTLSRLAVFGCVTLLALGIAVVEPLVRRLRRIHEDLVEQAQDHRRLALVAETTDHAVVLADADGSVEWVNRAMRELHGTTVSSPTPPRIAEIFGSAAPVQASWGRAVDVALGGAAARVMVPLSNQRHRDAWLDASLQPRWGEHGRNEGLIAVIANVSESVGQRTRLQTILNTLPVAVVELDARGRIFDLNPTASAILSPDKPDISHRDLAGVPAQWISDDLRPIAPEALPFVRAQASGVPVHQMSIGMVHADGSTVWLKLDCQPVTSGGMIVCFQDVTEQRAQRTMLRVALDANRIGTWDWQIETNQWQRSVQACAQVGLGPQEFEARRFGWYSAIHRDDKKHLISKLRSHFKDPNVSFDLTVRVRHSKGHWVWLHVAGVAVERSADGRAQRMVGIQVDITESMQRAEEARLAALTDSLTGLHNRAALTTRLQRAIELHERDPASHFAVLFFDLDRFKQVNDSLGHSVGDELLRDVAQRLRAELRPADELTRMDSTVTAARMGGDEFVIAIEGLASPGDAANIADRIMRSLSRPATIGGRDVPLSVSIGLVTSEWGHTDASKLLRDADIAMYEAKRSGRGRWVRFEPWMHHHVEKRSSLEADLREALRNDAISVAYQPVMDITGAGLRCAAVEALARWHHPQRGDISPVEFIAVAEDCGLIEELGQVVLRKACVDFKQWTQTLGDLAPPLLSVNVSVAQLTQSGFAERVRKTLKKIDLPPERLQLELTESLASQDDGVLRRLRKLRSFGVKLALDDFGTGYSSLSCLHLLPITAVKIDRSFTVELERSAYQRTLVEATVRVARSLGIACIAEGVETPTQLDVLRDVGCEAAQGNLISRPLDYRQLSSWLMHWQQHFHDSADTPFSGTSAFDVYDDQLSVERTKARRS